MIGCELRIVESMKSLLRSITLGLAALALTACGVFPSSCSVLPLWPHRLELGSGVVVAFVEGLTPEMSEKVAYVTHVPTGSQAILDREGKVVGRHDGRADGPSRLDAVLEDDAAMARITAMSSPTAEGARPRDHTILWVPLVQFGGIQLRKTRGTWLEKKFARSLNATSRAEDLGS